MRTLLLFVCASMLLACGGASSPSGETTPSPPSTHWRDDLSCNEAEPSGQAECEARGCEWQASLLCSGTPMPPERIELHRQTAACTCVCHADLMRCISMP